MIVPQDKRASWIRTLTKHTKQCVATAHTELYATTEYLPSSRASIVQEAVYEGGNHHGNEDVRNLPPISSEAGDISNDDHDPKYDCPSHTTPHLDPLSPASSQQQEPKSPEPSNTQQAVMSSNSPRLYEELTGATRGSINPYATCYQTPTQSQSVLVEPNSAAPKALKSNPSSHSANAIGALSGVKSKYRYRGTPLPPVSHGDDKPAKHSLSTSDEYEEMMSPCSVAYDVPTEKAQDVFDDPAGGLGYTYIRNDKDIRKARTMPHSSKRPYLPSQSTVVTPGHLQGADPTTLQLSILQQMQEVLAQMQTTYGQTQLPGWQSQGTDRLSALKIVTPDASARQSMEICLRKCSVIIIWISM